MNLNLVKDKLASLKGEKGSGSKLIWKPKVGKQLIRFLPYKHNPDWPITELSFHYDIPGTSILSPEALGKPDPINEFAEQLRKTGAKEDFLLSRKIQSKPRWFAPVLVRGEETEGVKFWGFSKTIYEQLLTFAEDEDFGDFTDPKSGRDFTIDFTAAASAEAYPETKLTPKIKTSAVTDNPEVLGLIKDMPDVTTLFKTMPYDELKAKLEKFLRGATEEEDDSNDTVIEDDADEVDDLPAAFNQAEVKPKTTTKTAPATTALADMDQAFNDMFKD